MEQVLSWIEMYTWVLYIFIIVFVALILSYSWRRISDKIQKRLEETPNGIDDAVFQALRKPIRWGIALIGLIVAVEIAALQSDAVIFDYIDSIRNLSIIFLIAWFGYRLVTNFEGLYEASKHDSADIHTIGAIAKIVRASVLITAALISLDTLGVPIAGVLAFGGVGGIAVGFAARDLLANFFGAFMLFLDKPFIVGDWIRSPDQEIEGTVENIGWRVTRIRTFDQRPLYVPNSTFTNLSVENPSRMLNRRIYETIGVRYDDLNTLPLILEDIRTMLKTHEEIDTQQTLMVNLNYFNESSVDFFIYTFTKTTVWTRFHEIKEDVLLRISTIIAKHGGEIAFPTHTLHIEQPDEAQLAEVVSSGIAR